MRISDWSSDVCSSDLAKVRRFWARQPDSTLRPKLLSRLYGYLENSPAANPAFAASFLGQGREHIDRAIFAHVPRWARSAERRVGQEWVRQCRSRGAPDQETTKHTQIILFRTPE